MGNCTVFEMDNTKVSFTPEGKISVIDAIQAVTRSKDYKELWKTISDKNPSIMKHCELYQDYNDKPFLVADIEGWDKISFFLFEELTSGRE